MIKAVADDCQVWFHSRAGIIQIIFCLLLNSLKFMKELFYHQDVGSEYILKRHMTLLKGVFYAV